MHMYFLSFAFCRKSCTDVANTVKKIAVAMENGEYDYDGTQEKVVSTCVVGKRRNYLKRYKCFPIL